MIKYKNGCLLIIKIVIVLYRIFIAIASSFLGFGFAVMYEV